MVSKALKNKGFTKKDFESTKKALKKQAMQARRIIVCLQIDKKASENITNIALLTKKIIHDLQGVSQTKNSNRAGPSAE